MRNLKYLWILLNAKLNNRLQRKYYVFENKYKNIVMRRFSDLFLTKFSNIIYMEIDYNMAREKDILLKIIKKLLKEGKKVYLYEKVEVFTDNDILNLYNISRKVVLYNRYMDISNEIASNQILETDISAYVLIINKLNYFQKNVSNIAKKI